MEITIDNCALEDWQLDNLDEVFTYIVNQIAPESKSYLDILLAKVKKLNEFYCAHQDLIDSEFAEVEETE